MNVAEKILHGILTHLVPICQLAFDALDNQYLLDKHDISDEWADEIRKVLKTYLEPEEKETDEQSDE